jgi:uncharacterized protein YjbJ (UPF0337 family)
MLPYATGGRQAGARHSRQFHESPRPTIDGLIEEANEVAGEIEGETVLDGALIACARAPRGAIRRRRECALFYLVSKIKLTWLERHRRPNVVGTHNSWRKTMDWNRVEGNWKQTKGKIKEKWGQLTDDDLSQIDGKRDQLEGKIQERYGLAKDRARKDVEDWLSTIN